jgi:hypothetical protein
MKRRKEDITQLVKKEDMNGRKTEEEWKEVKERRMGRGMQIGPS